MIGSRDPVSCVLLFAVSLTSPRLLLRLLSYSEAPFGTPRNLFWLRALRSDSPLYFMSVGPLALHLKIAFRWEPVYRILFSRSETHFEWEIPYCSRTRAPEWRVLRWIHIYVCRCWLLPERSAPSCAPSPARLVSRNVTLMPVFSRCVSSRTNACMTQADRSLIQPCPLQKGVHNAVKPRALTF